MRSCRQSTALWKPMDVPSGPSRCRLGRSSVVKPHLIGPITTSTTRRVSTHLYRHSAPKNGPGKQGNRDTTRRLTAYHVLSRAQVNSLPLSLLSYPQLKHLLAIGRWNDEGYTVTCTRTSVDSGDKETPFPSTASSPHGDAEA